MGIYIYIYIYEILISINNLIYAGFYIYSNA